MLQILWALVVAAVGISYTVGYIIRRRQMKVLNAGIVSEGQVEKKQTMKVIGGKIRDEGDWGHYQG